MNDYTIKIEHSDLASRQAAAHLRLQVERLAEGSQKIQIDFSNVFSISESYADELFGVLAIKNNLDWLTAHVSILHANEATFRSIANAIRQRLSENNRTPDIALLSARKALKSRHSHA